jgi:hypothetical protein
MHADDKQCLNTSITLLHARTKHHASHTAQLQLHMLFSIDPAQNTPLHHTHHTATSPFASPDTSTSLSPTASAFTAALCTCSGSPTGVISRASQQRTSPSSPPLYSSFSDEGELLRGLLQPLLLGDGAAEADGEAGTEPFASGAAVTAVAAASRSLSQVALSWQSSSRLWLSLLVLLLLSPLLLLVPLLVPAAAATAGEDAAFEEELVAAGALDEVDVDDAADDDEDVEFTGRPGASTSACTRSPLCAALTSITSFKLAASHACRCSSRHGKL